MSDTQSNVQQGAFIAPCGSTFTDLEGRLAVAGRTSGVLAPALPGANADNPLYLVTAGAAIGSPGTFDPVVPGRQARVRINGTCVAGDQLVLADVAASVDKGKLRKLPATTGTYYLVGVAEEDAVDEQLVRVRFATRIAIVVP